MNRKSICYSLAGLSLVCLSGCVRETTEDAAHTFTYEWWVPTLVFLVGLTATYGGWLLKSDSWKFGGFLLIFGPIGALLIAPSLVRDRAIVNDNSYSQRTGLWGMTAHDVKLDDVKQIRVTMEETTGRRGRKTQNFYLVCDRKDGSAEKISVNNKIAEAALPLFLDCASRRGIPTIDQANRSRGPTAVR